MRRTLDSTASCAPGGSEALTRRQAGDRIGALLLAACLALATVVGTAGAAAAYWRGQGAGTGQARTGTLLPPTEVNAELDDTDSVDVDWAPPSGLRPTGYYVVRNQGATAEAACGSGPTALLTATSCVDDSLMPNRYTYTVVAVAGSWTSRSATSNAVTVVAKKHLAITRQPRSDVPKNGSLGQVLVQLRDPDDNDLNIKNVLVSVTLNPASGDLSGAKTQTTKQNGQAKFSALKVQQPGTYTLTFTAAGYAPVTSDPFVYDGRFAQIRAQSGSGQSTAVGTEFDQPVAFRVSDTGGNPVAGVPVSFAPRPGVDGASGIVTGPTTATTGADGTVRTTVRANAHEGEFAVEATTTGPGGALRATSVLTNTAPELQSTPSTGVTPTAAAPTPTATPTPSPVSTTTAPTPTTAPDGTSTAPTPTATPTMGPPSSTAEPTTVAPPTTPPVPPTGPESTRATWPGVQGGH